MTTALLKAVITAKLGEGAALDLLQEAGAISDLCVRLCDIADVDCAKAVGVLRIAAARKPK